MANVCVNYLTKLDVFGRKRDEIGHFSYAIAKYSDISDTLEGDGDISDTLKEK